MTTEVSLCNLALSHLGDRAGVSSINPPDSSAQAQHCAQFYPIARDATLADYNWSFARHRATLAELLVEPPPTWGFGYVLPTDYLVARAIVMPGQTNDDGSEDYEIEGETLYTNVEAAVLKYTRRISDPNRFSPLFVDALAWRLASYLAGPVLKGDTGRAAAQASLQFYDRLIAKARVVDANQGHYTVDHTPGWMAQR